MQNFEEFHSSSKKEYLQTSLHCVCFEMICSDRGVCSKLSNQHLSLELKSTSSLFTGQYNKYILRCGHVHTYYTIIKMLTASINKKKHNKKYNTHSGYFISTLPFVLLILIFLTRKFASSFEFITLLQLTPFQAQIIMTSANFPCIRPPGSPLNCSFSQRK